MRGERGEEIPRCTDLTRFPSDSTKCFEKNVHGKKLILNDLVSKLCKCDWK